MVHDDDNNNANIANNTNASNGNDTLRKGLELIMKDRFWVK